MKRPVIGFATALFFAASSLVAAPTVWTPADDALPAVAKSFTETPIGRFETIAVGSFPITLFYVGFGFDLAAYAQNGFDSAYAPWPFKSANAPAPSPTNLEMRLGTAVALSLSIAVLDQILKPLAEARAASARGDLHFPQPPPGTNSTDGNVDKGSVAPASSGP